MKKIVITGAAGFLGSHLVKVLLRSGHQLIGIDNLSTGKLDNLLDVIEEKNFTFINHNVSLPTILEHPYLTELDEVYHLASPASPQFYQAAPLDTIAVNTLGTKHLLDVAVRSGAAFLFTSTSEAYGDPLEHPQPESYFGNVNTWGPRACYDEAKRLGEVICYEYQKKYEIEVKVARIFNTYSAGLRNDDGRVISSFITQALSGSELTVYGDGSQSRSFCYVDDTIDALIRLMESDGTTGIMNIGNPEEHSILELAQLVIELTGTRSPITYYPLPQDDPRQRRPVIEKAKKLLNWEPKVGLRDGLQRTIQSYRDKMDWGGRQ